MNPFFKLALYPLSLLYEAISSGRNMFFERGLIESYKCSIPVISVGNISAGGNGKTPLCIFLAQKLAARGYKPVILTRGYGGSLAGPLLVQAEHNVQQVGDEACLMSKLYGLSVVVARKRAAGAKFIEQRQLGTLIILDDGFQHRRLQRDLDIVSINVGSDEAVENLLNAELLPLGKFREPRDAALRRADIVVLAYRRPFRNQLEVDRRIIRILPPNIRACRSFIKPKGVWSLDKREELRSGPIVAFCALANPENFFESLKDLGFQLAACKSFADHHQFTIQEIRQLQQDFPNLPCVCSEKDAIKLIGKDLAGIYILQVELEVNPTDAFLVQVERGLKNLEQGRAD